MERLTYRDMGLVHPINHKASVGKCDVCKTSNGIDCGDCAYGKILDALCAYEDLNRTPADLSSDLAELAAYRAKGKVEDLEKVVRCGECCLVDTVNCYGSCKNERGWFTPRSLGGCLNGEKE